MKSRDVLTLTLALGLGATAWAQGPTPTPAPRPPAPSAPSEVMRQGMPPTLPVVPIDESTLSEEERARLEHFRQGQLPPDSTFDDVVKFHLTPRPYPKDTVIKIDEEYAHPHPVMPWKMEIVKEDEESIWLRGLSPENPESMLHQRWKKIQQSELLYVDREHLRETAFFLDFAAEIVPPPFVDSLRFEPVETELPTKGRWQMNFAVADMNGDGVDDLVFPPERMGIPHPTIFLGQDGGGFTYWREARWMPNLPWDYGGVAAEDFDGDGDIDLAFAIHFKSQFILYNEGDGRFGVAKHLPSPDRRLSSRAPVAADFDGDGRMDLAFLAEINYDMQTNQIIPGVKSVWVVLNRGDDAWQVVTEGMPGGVIGDSIRVMDMNGDERPDLLLGSNTTDFRDLVVLNHGDRWGPKSHLGVLSNGWHYQVLPDRAGDTGHDLVAVFNQFKMTARKENLVRSGIIRYPWGDDGLVEPGEVVVVADAGANTYFRLATGDLNGDGRTDLVAARNHGGLEIYIQSEDGEFLREQSPELQPTGRPFHIELLDLNGDGRDDVVASFALREEAPGGVRVWLTQSGT